MTDLIPLIIANIIPLYILVGLGFIAGRYMDVNLNSIAKILIFILSPIVAFGAIINVSFQPSYILLPILMYGISTGITLLSYQSSKKIWSDGNANLIGAGSVNGNAVFFGLSIILALFDPEGAGIYLFMNLGPMLNNYILAYYLTARGRFDVRESLLKLTKLPVIHAVILAFLLNILGFELPQTLMQYWEYSSGAMIILGMMMIGIGLSKLEGFRLDWGLIGALLSVKFILWPLSVFGLILLDLHIFQLFSIEIYKLMALFSAMPVIGNLVAYAAEHNLHPERAASAVVISTALAIFTVPGAYWAVHLLISMQ